LPLFRLAGVAEQLGFEAGVGTEGAPIEISWRWRELPPTCLWGCGWLGTASERVIEGEVDVQGLMAECVAKNLPAEF
jgi:hypothetical protein